MSNNKAKLSTEPYKGVRDFFPEDMAIENAIFDIWRNAARKYGYEEYNASVLEPADLYKAKTGEEIVNEQTYTFTDRGDREVTLRPEMTPTVARMVAARKRELIFPLRWFSIPNLFRYEQPQRGRVREHWQLNVDIFGAESTDAEVEVINMAYDITHAYGLKDADFEIRVNNRKIVNYVLREVFALGEEPAHKIAKLIDKKRKMSAEDFELAVREMFQASKASLDDPDAAADRFLTLLNSQNFEEFVSRLPQTKEEHQGLQEVREVLKGLERLGITNARFDQTLMRGFDYYTGIVFEVFDLNPANRRSVFGGGRYDDLLALFGNEKVPAVGFGAGDVVARDLMETYGNLPKAVGPADIAIIISGAENAPYALDLAQDLRGQGLKIAVDLTFKKVSDQISKADKKLIPYIIVIGEDEVKGKTLTVKRLDDKTEKAFSSEELGKLVDHIRTSKAA